MANFNVSVFEIVVEGDDSHDTATAKSKYSTSTRIEKQRVISDNEDITMPMPERSRKRSHPKNDALQYLHTKHLSNLQLKQRELHLQERRISLEEKRLHLEDRKFEAEQELRETQRQTIIRQQHVIDILLDRIKH
ncbi:hypothetical protein FQR65_LT15049 [Abscondita terminalis]|nr:hypothetical protein FQR65_LT15049 [Abscondita terminalis]